MCKSLSNVFIPISHSQKVTYCEEKFLEGFNHVPMETVVAELLESLKRKPVISMGVDKEAKE